MNLSLRANEKIYINGAILRFDRKVSLELMNDATFLLETHVLQPDQTTTPLRQLYFVVQTMLIEPRNAGTARLLFDRMLLTTACIFEDEAILLGLQHIDKLIAEERYFEALKQLRALYPAEAAILASSGQAREPMFEKTSPNLPIVPMRLEAHVA
ncbi:MAG TPA: flagellar biosynthesis repressor FlbT [Bosea sp. (in: a-proteobacteria)]|jgi:flagellar protein FlbT|uniref:flagellar biosynthesis repressor FlbT n=1 Tax=Bosea sp. (in: a-proteobacteria) TaxID=1871050 RepID=UPI002E0D0FCC|nr:flagellar biosynthesis repressor FlbT [Bosea sp. (in: a-proteobacteria)]